MPATVLPKLKAKFEPGAECERCGLILKSGKVVEVDNAHPEPAKGFAISASVMHKYRKSLAGTWHTHPRSPAALSQDDYIGFGQWPGITHYIIGQDGVRAYEANDAGMIKEVSLA